MRNLPPGASRRRLGNFRTPQLAQRVREVLDSAGIASSSAPDPQRSDVIGRWLDWLVHMTGARGNRIWVAPEDARRASRALRQARRAETLEPPALDQLHGAARSEDESGMP